jgi:hypothetical protein
MQPISHDVSILNRDKVQVVIIRIPDDIILDVHVLGLVYLESLPCSVIARATIKDRSSNQKMITGLTVKRISPTFRCYRNSQKVEVRDIRHIDVSQQPDPPSVWIRTKDDRRRVRSSLELPIVGEHLIGVVPRKKCDPPAPGEHLI